MLKMKLKNCYQNFKGKYKLTPFPISIQVDCNRQLTNPSFPVLLLYPVGSNVSFILAFENLENLMIFEVFWVREKNTLIQNRLFVSTL